MRLLICDPISFREMLCINPSSGTCSARIVKETATMSDERVASQTSGDKDLIIFVYQHTSYSLKIHVLHLRALTRPWLTLPWPRSGHRLTVLEWLYKEKPQLNAPVTETERGSKLL